MFTKTNLRSSLCFLGLIVLVSAPAVLHAAVGVSMPPTSMEKKKID